MSLALNVCLLIFIDLIENKLAKSNTINPAATAQNFDGAASPAQLKIHWYSCFNKIIDHSNLSVNFISVEGTVQSPT